MRGGERYRSPRITGIGERYRYRSPHELLNTEDIIPLPLLFLQWRNSSKANVEASRDLVGMLPGSAWGEAASVNGMHGVPMVAQSLRESGIGVGVSDAVLESLRDKAIATRTPPKISHKQLLSIVVRHAENGCISATKAAYQPQTAVYMSQKLLLSAVMESAAITRACAIHRCLRFRGGLPCSPSPRIPWREEILGKGKILA